MWPAIHTCSREQSAGSTGEPALITFRRVLAALLATILFSFSTVTGHRSAKLIGGAEANFWRLTLATFLLGLWSYLFGIGLSGAAFPTLLVSGIIGIGIGDVAWFQGLPRLGSRLSSLFVQCLSAPLGALVEWLWLGTGLSTRQIFWGLLILAGLVTALRPGESLRWRQRSTIAGIFLCALAALCTASGAVLSRRAYQIVAETGESLDGGNAAFQRIAGGLVIGGIFLLIVKRQTWKVQAGAPHELITAAAIHKWRGAWRWVALNALAGQVLGVSCMQWALETTSTGVVLAIISTTPIAVLPLAAIFEGERLTLRAVMGAALGVAGVIGLTLCK